MTGIKNIICKQTVNFQYNGQADGLALQKEVGDWCTHVLLPQLEQQLEKFCLPNWHLALDKIEVTAAVNETNWKEKIHQQVIQAIQEKLANEQVNVNLQLNAAITATDDGNDNQPAPHVTRKKAAAHKQQKSNPKQAFQEAKDTQANTVVAQETKTLQQQTDMGIAVERKKEALVIFFLQHGYLPWWSNTVLTVPFTQFLPQWLTGAQPSDIGKQQQVQNRIQQLVRQLKPIASAAVTARLANHLPGSVFFTFAKLAFPQAAQELNDTSNFLTALFTGSVNQSKYRTVLQQVYHYWLGQRLQDIQTPVVPGMLQQLHHTLHTTRRNSAVTVLAQAVTSLPQQTNPIMAAWQQLLAEKNEIAAKGENPTKSPAKQKRATAHKRETSKPSSSSYAEKTIEEIRQERPVNKAEHLQQLEEGIYIENAGAVIIAPFLPALFNKLKLASNGNLLKPEIAVLLVQHIVTGQTTLTEPELVLPKILCGLETDAAVNTNRKITALQKKETTAMLASAIEHWAILKNTSVQGLREAFLQRNGKLRLINNQWLLQVEQKSYDMLLQQLPWNIGLIKLTWMNHLLKTEWV